jgi:hypothetical protein
MARLFIVLTMALMLLWPGSQTLARTALQAPAYAHVYVDDDFDSSTTGWGQYSFDKIQDGVDAVEVGGLVEVEKGIYEEIVVINKSLTLQGEQSSVDPRLPGARTNPADESILRPPPTDPAEQMWIRYNLITVHANNVTVSGFTLDGNNPNINTPAEGDCVISSKNVSNGICLHIAGRSIEWLSC